uniref:Microtubule associated serine/threonine kinase family member 4 n=1 Tax=Aquila chrysaetos chrysaetos TaxID=223781 RepID=A0A663F488_AQUCH
MNACFINRIIKFCWFFFSSHWSVCQCFPRLGSGLHFDSTVPSSDCSHEAGEKLPRKIDGKSRSHWLKGQMVHNLYLHIFFFSVSLQLDHILSPPPMPFRKSSSPEVSSGPGKSSKFKRQLSEDGRQLRRGSLGGALTGKYLLPSATGQQLWQPAETSNLVRMRYQALGQSAPSLTASLVSNFFQTPNAFIPSYNFT